MLDEELLMPLLLYGSEKMIWREKERSTIRAWQLDNLKGLLGISRMERLLNARIRELCGVAKGDEEIIDESILR